MSPFEVPDYASGKKASRRPGFVPPTPERVLAVERREALDVFGCRSEEELRRHLRRLRDEGRLICSPGRLTARVRTGRDARGYPRFVRCYVLRGDGPIPRRRKTRRRIHSF